VEDIDGGGILITQPDPGVPTLLPGQEILVRYYRSDSAYQFLTKVLPPAGEGAGSMFLRIGFPSRITRYQRREHARLDVAGTIRFRLRGEVDKTARGFIANVSAGGIQFATRQMGIFDTGISPVGKTLSIDMTLENGEEFLGLSGVIRRVLPDRVRENFVMVQIEFEQVTPKTQQRLQQTLRRLG
jgi:c-di-GMP-binding flagellar brake protein YcgR